MSSVDNVAMSVAVFFQRLIATPQAGATYSVRDGKMRFVFLILEPTVVLGRVATYTLLSGLRPRVDPHAKLLLGLQWATHRKSQRVGLVRIFVGDAAITRVGLDGVGQRHAHRHGYIAERLEYFRWPRKTVQMHVSCLHRFAKLLLIGNQLVLRNHGQ